MQTERSSKAEGHNTRRFRERVAQVLPRNKFSNWERPWRLFWRDTLGDPECRYITRWVIDLGPLGTLRLHHWYRDDDQRAHHDHPWGFLTVMVRGEYADVTQHEFVPPMNRDGRECAFEVGPATSHGGIKFAPHCGLLDWQHPAEALDVLHAGSLRWRPAEHTHTVRVGPDGAWTLLWTQPKRRFFGFVVRSGGRTRWFKANRFFATFGHPPCS